MAGCLPATAILHIRQLSLFSMLSRLPGDPIHLHAENILITRKQNNPSWLSRIRALCLQYCLPHPLSILEAPPTKLRWKNLVLSKVLDFWETKLRAEAAPLSSLAHFNPSYMSLTRPHPLWWTAGSNPYEVSKAVVQCKMLSGRYRTFKLSSKWSESGNGFCPSPFCHQVVESLEHILLHCPAYMSSRNNIIMKVKSLENPAVMELVTTALQKPSKYQMQFLLDLSVLPETISLVQQHGEDILSTLFSISRSWCYSVHKDRQRIIKLLQEV